MPAFASLLAYDMPALRPATDAWWDGLAGHLRRAGLDDVPTALTRSDRFEAGWRDPDLLLAQSCGYPLMLHYADSLRPLVTPHYACDGCRGARYRSAIIVRADDAAATLADLRGRRAAINGWASHSGMNALRHSVAPHAHAGRFFSAVIVTGGHRGSVAAVRDGRADGAAIDGVTWALLGTETPDPRAGTRRLAWTVDAPALPYVTSTATGDDRAARLRAGILAALTDPALAATRATLLIAGGEACDLDRYAEMPALEQAAVAAGYPVLA